MKKQIATWLCLLLLLVAVSAGDIFIKISPDGEVTILATNAINSTSYSPASPRTGDNITFNISTIDERSLALNVSVDGVPKAFNHTNSSPASYDGSLYYNTVEILNYSAGQTLDITIHACTGTSCATKFEQIGIGSSISAVATSPAVPIFNTETSVQWSTHLPANSSVFWEVNSNGTLMSVEDSDLNTSHSLPIGSFSGGTNVKYYILSCLNYLSYGQVCERNPLGTTNHTFIVSACGDGTCNFGETSTTCPADCPAGGPPSGPTGGPTGGSTGGSMASLPVIVEKSYSPDEADAETFLSSYLLLPLEGHFGKAIDTEKTLEETELLHLKDISLSRKATAIGSETDVLLTLVNNYGTISDFLLVETVPKSAADNIGKIEDFQPSYTKLLEADPVFAYHYPSLRKGTYTFNYTLKKSVTTLSSYSAPLILKLRFEQPPPPQLGACGNGLCEEHLGEDCSTCSDDCGPCSSLYCGDFLCSAGESCLTCPIDCGSCAEAAVEGITLIGGIVLSPTMLLILAVLILAITGYAYMSYSTQVKRDLLHTDAQIQQAKRALVEAPPIKRAVAQQYVDMASQKLETGKFDEANLNALQAMREAGTKPQLPPRILDRKLTSAERMLLIKKSVEKLAKATGKIKERY